MFIISAFLLTANIMLGGATRAGILSDAVLQLLSVPGLLAVLYRWDKMPATAVGFRTAIAVCCAIVLMPLVQLLPMPAGWVAQIEPNTAIADVLRLVGMSPSFRTLSVSPYATALGALSLLPPVTLFLLVLGLSKPERRHLSLVLIALGLLSIGLGLLQLAQGSGSRLRFHAYTNFDDAVGFFANRNHFSALIYCAIVLAVAWFPQANPSAFKKRPQTPSRIPDFALTAVVAAIVFVMIVAAVTARSRAGIVLALVALPVAIMTNVQVRQLLPGRASRRIAVGVFAALVLFVFEFSAYRMVERFTGDASADSRISFTRNTIAAAKAYMPFGAGVGTFTVVYPQFPKVGDEVIDTYANRAHNDVLELWLEGGLLFIGIAIAFLATIALHARRVWPGSRTPSGGRTDAADAALARASLIVIVLLLVHSSVDYPLRTGAMMSVLAFACATLVAAPMRGPALAGTRGTRGSLSQPVAA